MPKPSYYRISWLYRFDVEVHTIWGLLFPKWRKPKHETRWIPMQARFVAKDLRATSIGDDPSQVVGLQVEKAPVREAYANGLPPFGKAPTRIEAKEMSKPL